MKHLVTRAVTVILAAVAVGFLGWSLAHNWTEVSDAVAHANLALFMAGLALAGVAMAHLALLWGDALALLGERPRRGQVLIWWFVGELGKYVPGGVLSVVGRAEVARRNGTSRRAAYGSVPLSLVLRYFAGMLLFAALLPFDLANQRSVATLVVVLLVPLGLACLHPRVVNALLGVLRKVTKKPLDVPVPTWRQAVWEVLAYLPNWALVIASTYCTARSITPDVHFLSIALATLLSWTIGFLVFPIPAGAGIREVVFTASSNLPKGLAVTVALAGRVQFIIVDAVGAAICFPLLRRAGQAAEAPAGQGDSEPPVP